MRPTLQRSKSYGVQEVSKSAPEPTEQDTEITSSVFDWFPFRNRKPRTCTTKSELSQQSSTITEKSQQQQSTVEGTSPRSKIFFVLILHLHVFSTTNMWHRHKLSSKTINPFAPGFIFS